MQPQYFITSPDPDYMPKGSRDPLGLQVIWQHQGKKIIPFLSTVSFSVRDFQILCMARFLYGDKQDSGWPKFFLRFEQLMGYVRALRYPDMGFNGVERVRFRMAESNRYPVSNSPTDEIMSNQRPYGIWGKYIRPFIDIGFDRDEAFESVYKEKMIELLADPEIKRLISKVQTGERFYVERDSLPSLYPLFDKTPAERDFLLRKIICRDEEGAFQNRLYDFVKTATLPKEFMLYPFLRDFISFLNKDESALRFTLEEHIQTERVLSPISTVFRYLQTKPTWYRDDIERDEYITNCNRKTNCSFLSTEMHARFLNEQALLLGGSNWDLVKGLARRNAEVAGWRGGAAWIEINNDQLEVRHAEGALQKSEYDPEINHEHPYFISTFTNLFQQLQTA
ncbi:MAG: hypothetical protein RLZZ630_483 [Bacteroidota bacterium]|jgi:hypothetical protein